MKFIRTLIMLLVMVFALPVIADCEATIEFGIHTDMESAVAMAGALEEATDSCYPGKAEKLDVSCTTEINHQGSTVYRCTQSVSCNVCDADLRRKYEALN